MSILLLVGIIIVIMGLLEKRIYNKRVASIPFRIHVNGIRGKSTTTRLIAGGLRAAGYRVMAKTTGSEARLIYEDGREVEIKRRGTPRILEQMQVVREACRRRVDVLVVECMAIRPEMQWAAENCLIKSRIGVITNVREDHTDEMGLNLEEIAGVLALSIPEGGQLVTADKKYGSVFRRACAHRKTEFIYAGEEGVTDEELSLFNYFAFSDNIACALKVCRLLGVPRRTALEGMAAAEPDPGVMKAYRLQRGSRELIFINAFAANDPESTLLAWKRIKAWQQLQGFNELPAVGIFNNRSDRIFRVKLLYSFLEAADFKRLYLIGDFSRPVRNYFRKRGLKAEIRTSPVTSSILSANPLSALSSRPSAASLLTPLSTLLTPLSTPLIQELLGDILKEFEGAVLFAFGNIKGQGEELLDYFIRNGEEMRCS